MATNSKSPAFQFYAQDWLSDFKVKCLTYEQKGIYIDLLAMSWLDPLKGDVDTIARALHTPSNTLGDILGMFFEYKDGIYYNKKLESYREEKIKFIKKMSEAGKKGNLKKRELLKNKPQSQRTPSVNQANAEPPPSIRSSTSSSTTSTSNNKNNTSKDVLQKNNPKDKMLEFIEAVITKNQDYLDLVNFLNNEKRIPVQVSEVELAKFMNYWTELTRDGKKQKWELQKTFEVQKRLTTWFNNYLTRQVIQKPQNNNDRTGVI